MNNLTIHGISKTDLIRLYVHVLDIPPSPATLMVNSIFKWVESSGLEWTVKRMKALKTLYVNHMSNNTAYRSDPFDGIQCHKSDGTPKGPFRYLWSSIGNRRMESKALKVLNIYSSIILPGMPTKTQCKKFFTGVENPKPSFVKTLWHYPVSESSFQRYHRIWNQVSYDSISSWVSSSTKTVLHYGNFPYKLGTRGFYRGSKPFISKVKVSKFLKGQPVEAFYGKSVVENELSIADHVGDFIISCPSLSEKYLPSLARLIKDFPEDRDALYEVLWDYAFTYDLPDLTGPACDITPIVGKIGYIQERGAKLRAVANPLRVIQLKLSRLNNFLQSLLRESFSDCTFDQDKGIRWAKKKLGEGNTLCAFDLTDASSTIPFQDQIDLLYRIGPNQPDFHDDVEFFIDVVREGKWVTAVPSTITGAYTTAWVKGQPLGTVCSFALFALAHGYRLKQMSLDLGLHDSFVILGDDVIVVEQLSQKYYDFVVKEWGCDISFAKSIISNRISEFASRIISANGDYGVYKYSKEKGLVDPFRLMDVFKRFGKKAIHLIPSKLKIRAQLLSTCARPLGMGYIWKEKELLSRVPTLHGYQVDDLRPKLDDILPVKFFKRPGSYYRSIEVTSKWAVEAKAEAQIAFTSYMDEAKFVRLKPNLQEIDDGKVDLQVTKLYTYITVDKPIGVRLVQAKNFSQEIPTPELADVLIQKVEPLEDLQLKVLHINANTNNDSQKISESYEDVSLLSELIRSTGVLKRPLAPQVSNNPMQHISDNRKVLQRLRNFASEYFLYLYEKGLHK